MADDQVCLRNMSCKCKMCAGYDLDDLKTISKSISSTIKYSNSPSAKEKKIPMKEEAVDQNIISEMKSESLSSSPRTDLAAIKTTEDVQVVKSKEDQLIDDTINDGKPASPILVSSTPEEFPTVNVVPDSDTDNRPLQDRIKDSKWKTRKEAYDEIKTVFEKQGEEGRDLIQFLPSCIKDSNAGALDAGIQAVLAFLQNEKISSDLSPSLIKDIMPGIIDAFSGRPGTLRNAKLTAIKCIEAGQGTCVISEIITGLKHKKPKIPPVCAALLLEALENFGTQVIEIGLIIPELLKMCQSTISGVRSSAMSILLEVYKWEGQECLETILVKLRPAQKAEYEKTIETITPREAVAKMFLRGGEETGANSKDRNATVKKTFDPREFAETVNLLEALAKSNYKKLKAEPKWQRKVEALKIITEIIGPIPKLESGGDYGELISDIKIALNDSNIQIVMQAIRVLGALSDGLHQSFRMYAKMIYPQLLQRLTDKKAPVLAVVNDTLDNFFKHTLPLEAMLEEIKSCTDSSKMKAPAGRSQVFGFLTRNIANDTVSWDSHDAVIIKEFGMIGVAGLSDTNPSARDAAVNFMVQLLKVNHDKVSSAMTPLMGEIRQQNTRMHDKITALLKPESTSAKTTERKSIKTGKVIKKSSDAGTKKNDTTSPTNAPSSSMKISAPKSASIHTSNSVSHMTLEQAKSRMDEMEMEDWDGVVALLQSAKWVERKEAFEKLTHHVNVVLKERAGAFAEALYVMIQKYTNEFKESNINVFRAVFGLLTAIVEHGSDPCFPMSLVKGTVIRAVDKINDRKAQSDCVKLLMSLSEVVGPPYVIKCIAQHLPSVKSPIVHQEIIQSYLSICVEEFGAAAVGNQLVVQHALGPFGVDSPNPKVRSSAIKLLGQLHFQVGPSIKSYFSADNIKPQVMTQIDAECTKMGYDPTKAALTSTRKIKSTNPSLSENTNHEERTDISSKITKELLENLTDESTKTSWKIRSEAITTIDKLCESSGRWVDINKTILSNLLRTMKARLGDIITVKQKAVKLIGTLGKRLGPKMVKYVKLVLTELLACVGDSKKSIQHAALDALTYWIKHDNEVNAAGFELMLPYLAVALMNPVGRVELLCWMKPFLSELKHEQLNYAELVDSCLACLQDRKAPAREAVQDVLVYVIRSVGEDVVRNGCRDIKRDIMRTLNPMLSKCIENAASGGTSLNTAAANKSASHSSTANSSTAVEPTNVTQPPPAPTNTLELPKSAKKIQMRRPSTSSTKANKINITPTLAEESSGDNELLLKPNTEKAARLEKTRTGKWLFEEPKEIQNLTKSLQRQWTPYLSSTFANKLFAPSYEKGMMEAILLLSNSIDNEWESMVQSMDFVLKWSTFRICDNNVQALGKMLECLVKLFTKMKTCSYELDEVEGQIFIPYLLQECGQQKVRFRVKCRDLTRLLLDVFPANKYAPYIVHGMNAKNSRSKSDCIDLAEVLISLHGYQILGSKGLKELGNLVDATEKDVRESAIKACVMVFIKSGQDKEKTFTICNLVSKKGIDLVSARIARQCGSEVGPTTTESGSSFSSSPSVPKTPTKLQTVPPPAMKNAATIDDKVDQDEDDEPFKKMEVMPKEKTPSKKDVRPSSTSLFQKDLSELSKNIISSSSSCPSPLPHQSKRSSSNALSFKDPSITPESLAQAGVLFQRFQHLLQQDDRDKSSSPPRLVPSTDRCYLEGKDALKSALEYPFQRKFLIIERESEDVFELLMDIIEASYGSSCQQPLDAKILLLSLAVLHRLLEESQSDECSLSAIVVQKLLQFCLIHALDPRTSGQEDIPEIQAEEKEMAQRILRAYNLILRELMTNDRREHQIFTMLVQFLTINLVSESSSNFKTKLCNAAERMNMEFSEVQQKLDALISRAIHVAIDHQQSRAAPFQGQAMGDILLALHEYVFPMAKEPTVAEISQSVVKELVEAIYIASNPQPRDSSSTHNTNPDASQDPKQLFNCLPQNSPLFELIEDLTVCSTAGEMSSSSTLAAPSVDASITKITKRLKTESDMEASLSGLVDIQMANTNINVAKKFETSSRWFQEHLASSTRTLQPPTALATTDSIKSTGVRKNQENLPLNRKAFIDRVSSMKQKRLAVLEQNAAAAKK